MARDSDDAAAASLHLLDTHYRTHPATGPSERRAPGVTPGAPLNLGMVDYIRATVAEVVEVVEHSRPEATGPVGPAPRHAADVYDWCREHTADAGPEVQLHRDIVIYRQGLEHAIRLGDISVVRKHPCPACRTWGLRWDSARRLAVCWNLKCRDRHGISQAWKLVRLATQHVAAEYERKSLSGRAT